MDRRRRRVARKPKPQNPIMQYVVGFLVIVIAAGAGYGVWYVTRLPGQLIAADAVQFQYERTPKRLEAMRELVDTDLEGTYLGLVPKRFWFLYPESVIRDTLLGESEVSGVEQTLERKDGRYHLSITLELYEPHALWCSETMPTELTALEQERFLRVGQYCFFIDNDGHAFMAAPPLEGGALLMRYYNQSISELPQADFDPFTPTFMDDSRRFLELLERETRFRVRGIEITKDGDYQYRLHVPIAAVGEVVEDSVLLRAPNQAPAETVANLVAILRSAAYGHLRAGNFAYIDLRFGDTVYVHEGDLVEEESTEAASSTPGVLDIVDAEGVREDEDEIEEGVDRESGG